MEDSAGLAAQLQELEQLLEAGNLQAAVDTLHSAVLSVGAEAGMRVVRVGRQAGRRRHHQPWYDAECRAAKHIWLPCPRH